MNATEPTRRPGPGEAARAMGVIPMLAVTSGGLGFLRPASGTWGSLPPAVAAGLLALAGQPAWLIDVCLVLLLAIGSVACLRFGQAAERTFHKKDPGQVVADEVAGQAITLMPLFGAMLSALLLGERLHGYHLGGMALILGGIALSALAMRRAK